MKQVWAPARERALAEAAALQELIAAEGGNFELQAWDWRYYAEKRRSQLFHFDDGELKSYLSLERMIDASFETARRLFGLTFERRDDIDLPHPDARAFEVKDANGKPIALFIGDYFARPSKRSGAWMSSLRVQSRLDGETLPIVLNTMSFSPAGEGAPSLLSHDEAHTLFHEFGHALHGMLSDVTYPWLSGTAVARDFVELPSQLYEHWLDQPAILSEYARHHETGEPLPKELLDAVSAARRYGQGFATAEFLGLVVLRHGGAHAAGGGGVQTRRRSSRRPSPRLACPPRLRRATPRRISSTSSPAPAIRPATTATCGRRCSTPTPSRRLPRPAIPSILLLPRV